MNTTTSKNIERTYFAAVVLKDFHTLALLLSTSDPLKNYNLYTICNTCSETKVIRTPCSQNQITICIQVVISGNAAFCVTDASSNRYGGRKHLKSHCEGP